MKEKLYLVFEYIQDDLHGYIYRPEEYSGKLTPELVKVCTDHCIFSETSWFNLISNNRVIYINYSVE